jgi:hypothetical protein
MTSARMIVLRREERAVEGRRRKEGEGRWETGVEGTGVGGEEGIEKTGTGREQRERSRTVHHPPYQTLTIRDCLQ